MTEGVESSIERGFLEKALEKRKAVALQDMSSWERETGRGLQHNFGEYKLQIVTVDSSDEEILITEDLSKIATRVWDCAALTSKWFEAAATRVGGASNLSKALGLAMTPTQDRPIQVLELGSGTGLLSVALAKMGAAVLSTEYGAVVPYLESNCNLNGVIAKDAERTMVPGRVTCRELDWYNPNESLEDLFTPGEEGVFDLVVVTDCNLTASDSQGVIDMIHKYSTTGHTKVVTGVCREREGTPHFLETVRKDFRSIVEVPYSELHQDYKSERHLILRFEA